MNTPWFEKKRFGWGWGLPLTWQGWLTLLIFIAFLASLPLITSNATLLVVLVLAAVTVFSVIAWVTSGKPEWSNGAQYPFDKKRLLKFLLLLAAIVIIFSTSQLIYLRKAHSSFEHYYTFRKCVQLLQKTDTSGICRLASGQTITIVNINNKWYLEGDGPGVF
jgi:hypothetical protein